MRESQHGSVVGVALTDSERSLLGIRRQPGSGPVGRVEAAPGWARPAQIPLCLGWAAREHRGDERSAALVAARARSVVRQAHVMGENS